MSHAETLEPPRLDPGPELSPALVRALRADAERAWGFGARAPWGEVAARIDRLVAEGTPLSDAVRAALEVDASRAWLTVAERGLWRAVAARVDRLVAEGAPLAQAVRAAIEAELAPRASLWPAVSVRLGTTAIVELPRALQEQLRRAETRALDGVDFGAHARAIGGRVASSEATLPSLIVEALRVESTWGLSEVDFGALSAAIAARIDAVVEAELGGPDMAGALVRAELAQVVPPRALASSPVVAAPALSLGTPASLEAPAAHETPVVGAPVMHEAPVPARSHLTDEEAAFRDSVLRELDQVSPRIERTFRREVDEKLAERGVAPVVPLRRTETRASRAAPTGLRFLVPGSRRGIVATALALAAMALFFLSPGADDTDDRFGLEALAELDGDVRVSGVAADNPVTILQPDKGVVVVWLASADEPEDEDEEEDPR